VNIGGSDALVIERYDRVVHQGSVYKLNHEDYCQASGISSFSKYEEFEGPGFADCARSINTVIENKQFVDDFVKAASINKLYIL
jgi:serine/threonine-protein kinase HipA